MVLCFSHGETEVPNDSVTNSRVLLISANTIILGVCFSRSAVGPFLDATGSGLKGTVSLRPRE